MELFLKIFKILTPKAKETNAIINMGFCQTNNFTFSKGNNQQ
jgi:hypothetical protein